MARPRGRLQAKLIANQRQRYATYRKRREGLKKKASELSTLCGVQTLLVCVSPAGEIYTWPETGREVRETISRFQSLSPAARNKRKTEISGLLSSDKKQKSEPDRLDNEKLQLLDSKIKSVSERIQFLESKNPQEDEKKDRQADYPNHAAMNKSVPFGQARVAMDAFSGYNYESVPFDMTRVAMDAFSGYNYGAPGASAQPPIYADPLAFFPTGISTEFPGSYLRMLMED